MTMSAIDEAQGRVGPRIAPSYGYYRQPDGWITVSPASAMDELRYRRRGWTPLTTYGRVEMASPYAADHPLEGLFIRGGAHELTLEQIIKSGLHLNLPLIPSCRTVLSQGHPRHLASCMANAVPVVFPQLTGDEHGYSCEFCDRELPTEEARDQHAKVAHQDEQMALRSNKALAGAIVSGLSGGSWTVAAPTATSSDEVIPKLPYLCGFCAEGFKSPVALGKHVKDEHKAKEE